MNNKKFFDEKFENYTEVEGNAWRFNWRASQIYRMKSAAECVNQIISCDYYHISICEIGCASADFTNMYYRENGMRVLGIDISSKAIEICREKYKKKTNIRFVQGNILEMNFLPQFDLVICMDVLHYFNEEEQTLALANIKSFLNNKGKIVLMLPLEKKEIERNVMNNVLKQFSNVSYKYIYTEFYQRVFEKKCLLIYDILTLNCRFGKTGLYIANRIKRIVNSMKIFEFINRFDKKHIPSHIIITAEKQD